MRAAAPPIETPLKVTSCRSRTLRNASTPSKRTRVIAARGDIRIPMPRIVECIDREVVGQFWYHFFKQIQLRTQRVEQQQSRAVARSDVADGIAAEVSKVNRDTRGPWKGFGSNGRGSRGLDHKRQQPQADG